LRNNTIVENTEIAYRIFTDSVQRFPTICSGDSLILTVRDMGIYTWSTGEISQSIATPALFTNTTYTVTVTTFDREQTYVVPFEITVNPRPTVSVTVSRDSARAGDTVRYSAVGTPPGGDYHWQNSNTGADYHGSTMIQIMPASGDLQFRCTYRLNGCYATRTQSVRQLDCIPPVAPTGLTADKTNLCLGEGTTLHVTGGVRNSGRWKLYAGSCGGTLIDDRGSPNPRIEVFPTETTTYYLRLESGCGTTECVSITIYVLDGPVDIKGDSVVCRFSTVQFSSSTPGGVWRDYQSQIIRVDSATGLLTGLNEGMASVIYVMPNGCSKNMTVEVVSSQIFTTTDTNLCQGASTFFPITHQGGAWSSETPSVATVSPVGIVTASTTNVGSTVLSYKHPFTGCTDRKTVYVRSQPAKITGNRQICEDEIVQFNSAPTGGTWSISSGGTIDNTGLLSGCRSDKTVTGFVRGCEGDIAITYELPYGCKDTFHVRINPAIPSLLTSMSACAGSQTIARVAAGFANGTWATVPTTIATVSKIDSVSAQISSNSPGNYDLTYTSPLGCSLTMSLVVNSLPAKTEGYRSVGVGGTIELTNATAGGTWTSRNPNIARVDMTNGEVTGTGSGTTVISYDLPTGCRDTFHITVVPCETIALISGSTNQTACYLADIQPVVYLASSTTDPTAISWQKSGVSGTVPMPTGLTYNSNTLSGSTAESGIYTWTVNYANPLPGCPATNMTGLLVVHDPVAGGTIGSSQTICSGDRLQAFASIDHGSGGDPSTVSWQWQTSFETEFGPTEFSNISGATAPAYTENTSLTVGTYYYRRIYSTSCGGAESNILTVTVNALPEQPHLASTPNSECSLSSSNGSITVNTPIGMEYMVEGHSITYHSGNTFLGLAQGEYTVFVRNNAGCVNSNTVSVESSATGAPVINGFTVSKDSYCSTDITGNVSITVEYSTGGANTTFHWEWDGGSETTSANTLTVPVPGVTTAYKVVITNTDLSCQNSASKTIFIVEPVEVSDALSYDTICAGQPAKLISANVINANGNILSYQWQRSTDNFTGYSDIEGAGGETYAVPSNVASNYFYRCVVTPVNGTCPPATSGYYHVAVLEIPRFTGTLSSEHCGPGEVVGLMANATPATIIKWYDAPSGGNLVGESLPGEFFTTPNIAATTFFYAEASNAICALMSRQSVSAFILPEHTLSLTVVSTRTQAVCPNTGISIVSHVWGGGATGATISWQPSAPAGITGGAGSLSGIPSVPGTYRWTITTTGNACAPKVDTGSITVYVQPTAVTVTPSPVSPYYCYEATLNATNGGSGIIYWQDTVFNGMSTTTVASTRKVTRSATYYFRALSSNGCWGVQGNYQVTITVAPTVSGYSSDFGESKMSLNGQPFIPSATLSVTAGGQGPFTYQWYINTTQTNIGGTPVAGAIGASYAPSINMPSGVYYYYYCVIKNSCDSVVSNVSEAHHVSNGCNLLTPGWGNQGLGSITFRSGTTWTITNGAINQVWSDAVMANACRGKTAYTGGVSPNFNADCRENPGYGDYFSWCAVKRYGNELCPSPWRIPDTADYGNLYRALGGNRTTGMDQNNYELHIVDKLISTYATPDIPAGQYWAGALGGSFSTVPGVCTGNGCHYFVGSRGYYWSLSERDFNNGHSFFFEVSGTLAPQASASKHSGYMLRCVQ
jgi:uncharacterized protein (TIGR02145 family)